MKMLRFILKILLLVVVLYAARSVYLIVVLSSNDYDNINYFVDKYGKKYVSQRLSKNEIVKNAIEKYSGTLESDSLNVFAEASGSNWFVAYLMNKEQAGRYCLSRYVAGEQNHCIEQLDRIKLTVKISIEELKPSNFIDRILNDAIVYENFLINKGKNSNHINRG